jgi:chromate transporter
LLRLAGDAAAISICASGRFWRASRRAVNQDLPPASRPEDAGRPAPEERGLRLSGLCELASVCLKLGVIGFGGPAAHIGLMDQEFVRRRRWLSHEEFADLLAACNLIPGPNSTEMCIFVGQKRAGFPGLVVAGACFILPAMLIVMGIAWAYQRYGTLPEAGGLLYGIKPVMIAVVAQALWGLGAKTLRTSWQALMGAAALVLGFLGVNELWLLLGAGLAAMTLVTFRKPGPPAGMAGAALLSVLAGPANPGPGLAVAASATASAAAFGLLPLFLFFLKVGAVLYGSGYVLLAFLRADLVERWGWLTEAQLLDAVAVGQITPGPLFTTATFIGYVLGGPTAAAVATLGIFLPAFVLVAVSGPLLPRMRASKHASAFLDGVVVASLALMAVVTWHLGRAALVDPLSVALALGSGALLFRFRLNAAWLVLGGAAVGLAAARLGWVH